MPAGNMHVDEVDTDASLVRRLLVAQFPQWAALAIAPVPSTGTDHALYRLGDAMAVRLPRIERATPQVDKEHAWLPRLAPAPAAGRPGPTGEGGPRRGIPVAVVDHAVARRRACDDRAPR
jgi:aminoglycoside phosphotransferase (APT) family kinase protein